MKQPVILNFDDSVRDLDTPLRFDLSQFQERIRFASRWSDFKTLNDALHDLLPDRHGPIFLGSGDYHHISLLLLERLRNRLRDKRLNIVVVDNHPDNMRFPFGIHCGSWVSHAANLPFVEHVHVVGITSNDIGLAHAIENRLSPLFKAKLTYWSTGVNIHWAHYLGLKASFKNFSTGDEMISAFVGAIYKDENPVYLSIDKDALSPDCVKTNWDQGLLELRHLSDIITSLGNRLVASDITGEVSNYAYRSLWKRLLSKLDGQHSVSEDNIMQWQTSQQEVNKKLLSQLAQFL